MGRRREKRSYREFTVSDIVLFLVVCLASVILALIACGVL